MSRIAWQGLLPPAALPFVVSIAVALAGPGGLLGLTADKAGEPTSEVANSTPASEGQVRQERGPDATHAPVVSTTPDSRSVATPTPAPELVAVPPETSPQSPEPGSPAPQPATPAPTPQPTQPAPTPTPPIDEAAACTLAAAYAQSQIASVTIQVRSCTAQQVAGGWLVTMRIRHPGCAALDAQGLPCASSPLKLTFFVSDADRSVVAADAETQAILDTY